MAFAAGDNSVMLAGSLDGVVDSLLAGGDKMEIKFGRKAGGNLTTDVKNVFVTGVVAGDNSNIGQAGDSGSHK